MVRYPISVRRNGYGGRDPRKRQKANEENRIAAKMESAINEMLRTQVELIRSYHHYEIAEKIECDPEIVKRLGMSIDGGHNGFTAVRADLTFDQAWEMLHSQKSE